MKKSSEKRGTFPFYLCLGGRMRLIGNILWILLCGFWLFLEWALVGLLWCITIVGIPFRRAVLENGRTNACPVW